MSLNIPIDRFVSPNVGTSIALFVKNIVAMLILMICHPLFAQEHGLPLVDGKVNFQEVALVDGVKKDELHSRLMLWFANAFGSSTEVIKLNDKENGVVLGKGIMRVEPSHTWSYTVKVQLKDGRYKAEIYDIEYKYSNPGVLGALPPLDLPKSNLELYLSPNIKRNRTMRRQAAWVAENSNAIFTSLLSDIRSALSQGVNIDDF